MSDLLLQIIAVRLGALVVAGLLLQALPEQHAAPGCLPIASSMRPASHPDLAAHDHAALRDMRLHD